jgi:hypothetical protein
MERPTVRLSPHRGLLVPPHTMRGLTYLHGLPPGEPVPITPATDKPAPSPTSTNDNPAYHRRVVRRRIGVRGRVRVRVAWGIGKAKSKARVAVAIATTVSRKSTLIRSPVGRLSGEVATISSSVGAEVSAAVTPASASAVAIPARTVPTTIATAAAKAPSAAGTGTAPPLGKASCSER